MVPKGVDFHSLLLVRTLVVTNRKYHGTWPAFQGMVSDFPLFWKYQDRKCSNTVRTSTRSTCTTRVQYVI